MTKEELNFIGSMNMCDEISNEAYKKIVNHVEETEISDDCVSRESVKKWLHQHVTINLPFLEKEMFEQMENELPPVTPTRNKPKEDITEDEVRINMLELALNQAKEHAESIEVLTENHRLIFRAEKRGSENG